MRKLQTNLSRRQGYTNFPDRWDKKAIPINKNSLEYWDIFIDRMAHMAVHFI